MLLHLPPNAHDNTARTVHIVLVLMNTNGHVTLRSRAVKPTAQTTSNAPSEPVL
jgi:hypothetical protein